MRFDPEFVGEKRKGTFIKKVLLIVIVLIVISVVVVFCFGDKALSKIGIKSKEFNSNYEYGDVNGDEKVDSEDAFLILQHVNGKNSLDNDALKYADVDGNGVVDQLDAQLILKKTSDLISSFPVEENENGYIVGDVNQDGNISAVDARKVLQYVQNMTTLTEYQKVLADVSGDDVVTKLDSELILKYCADLIKSFPVNDPNCKYYTLGDVNEDGTVSAVDARIILQQVNNEINLTEIQKIASDINRDGKITGEDSELLLQVVAGNVSIDSNIPSSNPTPSTPESTPTPTPSPSSPEPTPVPSTPAPTPVPSAPESTPVPSPTPQIVYGDVNGDGAVTTVDANLVLQYVAGKVRFTENQKKLADYNKDGKVTAIDARMILQNASKK